MNINQLIISSKDILGGIPVFLGTRVPIKNLFDYLQAGDCLDDFLEDFPAVSREQSLQVLQLAQQMLLGQDYATVVR
jgi:uncharacterized protein (DUF433 family)